jgi:predicted unusual protein kinase regulating ubiquinone biosynthesis (AarF/ABC1/UbiB family)
MSFFARATASFIFWELILPRLGLRALTRRTRSGRYKKIAADFRAMAIRMGGVMIKVGQFLSSRLDVLPVEITEELAGLQDEVPAEDFAAIRALAEAELDRFTVPGCVPKWQKAFRKWWSKSSAPLSIS